MGLSEWPQSILDYLSGPKVFTRVLIRERREGRAWRGDLTREAETGMKPLNMEEGTRTQRMHPLEAEKEKKMDFALKPPEGNILPNILALAQ